MYALCGVLCARSYLRSICASHVCAFLLLEVDAEVQVERASTFSLGFFKSCRRTHAIKCLALWATDFLFFSFFMLVLLYRTVGDALAIASEMKAGFLILTHFSQRYKMPVLSGVDDSPVPYGVAFDMMVVRVFSDICQPCCHQAYSSTFHIQAQLGRNYATCKKPISVKTRPRFMGFDVCHGDWRSDL